MDPLHVGAAMTDPQQWNRYAYARNNPFKWVDSTGLSVTCVTGAGCSGYAESIGVSASVSPLNYISSGLGGGSWGGGVVCDNAPTGEEGWYAEYNDKGDCYGWFFQGSGGRGGDPVPVSGTPPPATTPSTPVPPATDGTGKDGSDNRRDRDDDGGSRGTTKKDGNTGMLWSSPNDCGSGFSVPNVLVGYNINSACFDHDQCYQHGPGGKFSCDLKFALDIQNIILSESGIMDYVSFRAQAAFMLRDIYLLGLTVGGWPAYTASRPVSDYWTNYRFGE